MVQPQSPSLWTTFTALVVVGGVYAGVMETRFRELSTTVETHRALPQSEARIAVLESQIRELSLRESTHELRPMHQQAEPKIAGLEQRVTRAELDLRNHLEQFVILRQLLADHDAKTNKNR